jgi:ubiquinone/menaquinone biosynthesis C-methylase UbiE
MGGKGDAAFSKKMTDILNFGALNLAMAIGYRTRLFDTLDTFNSPQTAAVIAAKADLDARYVTEWLAVMVTGEIIQLSLDDRGQNRYFLPEAHGDLITRRAGHANLGVYTQEIPLLTMCAMEPVLDGFRTGDGVSYDFYRRFQAFMTELADAKHRRVLAEKFLPSVADGRIVAQLQSGIRVCDLGCGQGLATAIMAQVFPNSEFVGIDISEEALQTARSEAKKHGLENLEFLKHDAAKLEENRALCGSFDYTTAFDAIHDQTQPLRVLKGVHAILKSGGYFSMVDIAASSNLSDNLDHPMGPFLYTVSLMHCMPVGLVKGGTGLGMMWGREKAAEMLREAGFDQVRVDEILDDPFNLHFLCKKN